ncbi:unnamed protein product [Phyllotreta striolata]|uniref:ZAD domain-containing protein n=1 Tax=Phyllotreta striolata TaxID=444603 RepID=A0A9N9TKE5_PHYSR|nr:unnamed protein product [Phyllotreta striolata]
MEKTGAKKRLLCRLCSAKRNLISLFKSSDFTYRCNIKKLISQAVSIQYEEGDGLKYVCCSCVIRSYNCYVFKVKCLENEHKLKNSFPLSKENNLPSLEVLRKSVEWLYNKSLGENDSELSTSSKEKESSNSPNSTPSSVVKINGTVEIGNSTDTTNESPRTVNTKASTPVTVDESVQTIPPKTFNVGVWAYHPPLSSCNKANKSTQTVNSKASSPVLVDESVQTIPPKTFNVGVSAYHPPLSCNKGNKSTQTKRVSAKSVSVACNIANCDILTTQNPAQLKQADGKEVFKSTQNKDNLFHDRKMESDESESSDIEQAVASNRKRKHKSTINNSAANKLLKTDCHSNPKKSSNVDTKCLEIEINEQITLEPLDIKSEPLSPAAVMSCSSFAPAENSLQFTRKVEYLRNCKECGTVLHTKADSHQHRKTHMKCYLCKKRFPSIKKAKEHMNSSCIRNICSKDPIISLEKLKETMI